VPLVINAFGSVRRMELAFDVDKLEDVAARIQGFLKMETPQGLFDKIKCCRSWRARIVFSQEREVRSLQGSDSQGHGCEPFGISYFEVWPQDGGRFITFPLVFTKNPETGSGMWDVRMQFTTSAPPGCIGRRKKTARNIFDEHGRRILMARLPWRWRSVRTRQRAGGNAPNSARFG